MKITINIVPEAKDTEITVSCSALTPEIEQILAMLRIMNCQLMAEKGGETYLLDVSEIVYIESVDRKTFVYTGSDCYESKLKLYELEERLNSYGFFRVSKSCIVRLKCIRSLRTEINRRIRLTLENGEQIIVSRQYADALKNRLGVR